VLSIIGKSLRNCN